MLTMEEAANSTPFDDTLIMNISYDKEQFMERDNKSDVMGLPGILATSIVLGLMTLTTIIGNVFVIAAILLERNLQSVANYLILSLAVADLLVAVLVMPLGAIYEISLEWTFGPILCDIWTSSDVLCCTASILHLLAIAIDRYWAVTHVHYIHNRTFRTIGAMIFFIWLTSVIVSLAPLFGWKDSDFETRVNVKKECIVSQDVGYQVFATMATFYVPLVLILLLYWRIFVTARNRLRTRLAQKTNFHSLPDRKRRKSSGDQVSGTVMMMATAHLDRKGRRVAYSVASSNGQEVENNPESISDAKDNVFKANDPQVANGKVEVNNGHAKVDDIKERDSSKGFEDSGSQSNDNETPPESATKNDKNGDKITAKLSGKFKDQGCQTEVRDKTNKKRRPNNSVSSLVKKDSSSRQLQQQDSNGDKSNSSYKQSKKKHVSLEAKRERKAAKTLAIVTGAFIACWLPFFIFALVMAIFKDYQFNHTLVSFFLWLGYFNSTLNPIIYTIFSPEFRSAFQRILCGKSHAVNHWPRHLQ